MDLSEEDNDVSSVGYCWSRTWQASLNLTSDIPYSGLNFVFFFIKLYVNNLSRNFISWPK